MFGLLLSPNDASWAFQIRESSLLWQSRRRVCALIQKSKNNKCDDRKETTAIPHQAIIIATTPNMITLAVWWTQKTVVFGCDPETWSYSMGSNGLQNVILVLKSQSSWRCWLFCWSCEVYGAGIHVIQSLNECNKLNQKKGQEKN